MPGARRALFPPVVTKFLPAPPSEEVKAPKKKRSGKRKTLEEQFRAVRGEKHDRVCYATRGEALRAFREANLDITERWHLHDKATGGEFDSINEKYELRGKKRVKTLAEAIDAALPRGRPYCLDRLDLEALNETTPGREIGPFRLPDVVEEHKSYASHMKGLGQHGSYLREQEAWDVAVPF